MFKFIKYVYQEIIETLLMFYDKLTFPMGAANISKFQIYFRPEGIFFQDYIFRTASIYPSGLISFTHIKEILLDTFPLEIRTQTGEILFIPQEHKEKLKEVAINNQIPIVSRIDVWSYILEPFLDTEFSLEEQENTIKRLEENDISRFECQKIRDSINDAMMAYNFTSGLWEWVHLGLYDVLLALSGIFSGRRHKLSEKDFKNFYHQAMELANRGKIISIKK